MEIQKEGKECTRTCTVYAHVHVHVYYMYMYMYVKLFILNFKKFKMVQNDILNTESTQKMTKCTLMHIYSKYSTSVYMCMYMYIP